MTVQCILNVVMKPDFHDSYPIPRHMNVVTNQSKRIYLFFIDCLHKKKEEYLTAHVDS